MGGQHGVGQVREKDGIVGDLLCHILFSLVLIKEDIPSSAAATERTLSLVTAHFTSSLLTHNQLQIVHSHTHTLSGFV